MKSKALLCALFALFAGLVSCTSSQTPESVADKVISSIQNREFISYASTFNIPSSKQKEFADFAESIHLEGEREHGSIDDYSILESSTNGNTAEVTVKLVYKDGTESNEILSFERKNGKWVQKMPEEMLDWLLSII